MPAEKIEIPDNILIEKCLDDDRHYQEALYRKYADKMYGVCLIYTENEEEACDVLQEGFIQVFRKLHQFKSEGSLEGWIRKIIINKALQLYNKKKRERENIAEYKEYVDVKVNDILSHLNAKQIIEMVNKLPTKAAMVLKLHAIEGYAHKEIAAQLNITEGTSKSQLNRARALLKDAINRLNG